MLATRSQFVGTLLLLLLLAAFSSSFASPGDIDLKCDLSRMNCSWAGVRTGWHWMRPTANSLKLLDLPLAQTGPNLNSLGAFLFGSTASVMTSPLVEQPTPTATATFCFTFLYYAVLDQAVTSGLRLNIVDQQRQNSTEIWYSGGVNADQWKKAMVRVSPQSKPFSLQFYAFGQKGLVAVQSDHFLLTPVKPGSTSSSSCQSSSIDFESGSGGFSTLPTTWNSLKFTVVSARSTSRGGIKADHTSRSPNGHFALLETPGAFRKTVDFMSGRLPATLGTQCFSFYFLHTANTLGNTNLHLELIETHRNRVDGAKIERLLWRQNSSALHWADEWIRVQRSIAFLPESRLTFRATKVGGDGSGRELLALDDINFAPFACDPPISCNFMRGSTCNWVEERNRPSNNLLWSFGNGRVMDPDKLRATLKDTILLPGQYMLYTDFTAAPQGSSMEMLSEFVQLNNATSGACISLFFLVRGFDRADGGSSFELEMLEGESTAAGGTILWQYLNETAVNSLQQVHISVPRELHTGGRTSFRLSLRASSSLPSLFIGVQRVDYSDAGVCGTATTSGTTKTPTTTTLSPAKTLNCDFEHSNFCNWVPNRADVQGGKNAFSIGHSGDALLKEHFLAPSGDHTKLSPAGHFAYVISDDASPVRSTATLRGAASALFGAEACFTFYFYFNTFGLSNFTLQLEKADQSREVVYSAYGSNIFRWEKRSLTIAPPYAYTAFVFSTTVLKGILALDDISVVSGRCPESSPAEVACDYETNTTCGLLEPVFNPSGGSSATTWNIYQGAGLRPAKIADHTTHTADGHFYGLDLSVLARNKSGSSSNQQTTTTVFKVQSRPVKSNFHCLKFSYLLADVSPNVTLFYEVPVEGRGGSTRMEIAGNTPPGVWFRRHQRVVTSASTIYNVVMGINTNGETQGKVFIDDLVLESWSGCYDGFKCDFDFASACNLVTVQQDRSPLDPAVADALPHHLFGFHMTLYYLTDFVDTTWIVYSPAVSAKFVPKDATLNSDYGGYFLLTGTRGAVNNRGIFITDRYSVGTASASASGDRSVCLSFALFKPDNAAVLEVYQGESADEKTGVKLWSRLAKSEPERRLNSLWETVQIRATPEKSQSVDIYFFFVGTLLGKTSYIAVDDLTITKTENCHHLVNPLATTPKTTPPKTTISGMTTALPNGFFRCQASGKVLPNSARCNWVKDCLPDGEDERNCGSCSFANHDLCGYKKSSSLERYYSYLFSDQSKAGPNSGPSGRSYLIASGDWAASAFLQSPLIQGSYSLCSFSFYYYYNESGLADPNHSQKAFTTVALKYPEHSSSVVVWHSRFAPLTPGVWHRAEIKLGRIPRPFQLWITSTEYYHRGVQLQAIGQLEMGKWCGLQPVKVPPGMRCGTGYFQCANKGCILATLVCNFEDNCGDASDEDAHLCDAKKMTSFEAAGYGRWGETLRKGWAIHSASTGSLSDGPTFDHTTSFEAMDGGGGHYLFAKADYLGRNRTVSAEIAGPPLKISPDSSCRINLFTLSNSENASLLVIAEDALTTERTIIHEISAGVGGQQQFAYHSLGLTSALSLQLKGNPTRIILSAIFKLAPNMYTNTPWIAVDDISFGSGPGCTVLDSVPPVTLPGGVTVTTVKPDNGNCSTVSCFSKANHRQTICLAVSQLCDLVEDCLNGEDERACIQCDFDHGTRCGWENRPAKSSWRLAVKAKDSTSGKLPKVDADGDALGGYLWADSPTFSEDAIMRSSRINSRTSPYCKLEFAFQAPAGTKFKVKRISAASASSSSEQLLLSSDLHTDGGQWSTRRIDLGEQAAGFSLQMESKTYTRGSFVALDNIRLLECAPDAAAPTTAKPIDLLKAVSCSFESDLCGWTITSPGGFRSNWVRVGNSTTVEPGTDHTCLQRPRPAHCGSWLTTQARADDHREADYLKTTYSLPGNNLTYCFSFWYYFYAPSGTNELGVYLTGADGKLKPSYLNSRWIIQKPRARKWLFQHLELSSAASAFYIYFAATASRSGVIGLDDLTLASGACPTSPFSCDFEERCDWSFPPPNPGWQVITKQLDHTTNTWQGHFLVDNAPVGTKAVMTKALSSLPFYANNHNWGILENFCLKFFYRFSVEGMGIQNDNSSVIQVSLHQQSNRRGTQEGLNLTILDALNDGRMNLWTPLLFNFLGEQKTTVSIAGLVGSASNGNTFIHLDDITLKPEACQVEGNCDFESNMCGWLNFDNGNAPHFLSWIITSPRGGFTRGEHMGYDHTSFTVYGSYLLLPVATERTFTSYLQSDIFHRRSEHICFTMYYFARGNGSSVAAMKLYLIDLTHADPSLSHPVTIYASPATARSLKWLKFEQEYRHIGRVFQFAITAAVSNDNNNGSQQLLSDVGVDDIKVTNSPCYRGGVTPRPTPVPAFEKILDEDFDDDTKVPNSNWSYDRSTWNVTSFSGGANVNAPRIDHTYHSSEGRYLLLTVPANYSNQTPDFSIKSAVTLSSADDHCLYFWYYEDGEGAFSLQVDTRQNGSTEQQLAYAYRSTIESRGRWNAVRAFISATTSKPITLSIHYRPSAVRLLAHYHVFALDDLSVRRGVCSHRFGYTYTFTDGFEDLNVEYLQPLRRGIGRIVTPATFPAGGSGGGGLKLPAADHTTNSPTGEYFLFANNGNGSDPKTTYIDTLAIMNIPLVDGGQWMCLRFAYQQGGNASTFNVRPMPVDSDVTTAFPPFWYSSGNSYAENTWTVAEVNVNGAYQRKMVFTLEKPFDRNSFIALDDLSVVDYKCQAAIDCDFDDQRMCAYSPYYFSGTGNAGENQVNFGLMTAPAADPSWPGPMYDLNRNWGGGYLYLTSFRSPLPVPLIISRIISGARLLDSVNPAPYCLSLYTALPSTEGFSLKLSLRRYGKGWTDGNRLLPVLQLQGNSSNSSSSSSGKDWTRQAVTIDINALLGADEVQLIIEGRIGAGGSKAGVIAVDGIAFKRGVCQVEGIDCENGVHVPQSAICNFVKDCPSGFDELNCGETNFEPPTGAGGWSNASSGNTRAHWQLTSARDAAALLLNFNAPRVDADGKSTGHYLLMVNGNNGGNSGAPSTTAEAALNPNSIAMHLKGAYKSCVMQFDYYLKTGGGQIQVRIGEDAANWNTVYLIRQQQQQQGVSTTGWRRAYAHLGLHYAPFMVELLGQLETTPTRSVAAVDNIHFLNCTFPRPLPGNGSSATVCPSNRPFLCTARRFCISEDELCSYVDECGDGSDERHCLPSQFVCNFEYGAQVADSCGIVTTTSVSNSTISARWSVTTGEAVPEGSNLPRIDNTRRTRTGHFFALERSPLPATSKASAWSGSFFLPPVTSKGGENAACRLRFYFFINGPPSTVAGSRLQVFARYSGAKNHQPRLLAEWHLTARADLQQRWRAAVVSFTSSASADRPFQFLFTGLLADNTTSLAVDDLTYSPSCLPSKVRPATTTTTTLSPPVTASGQPSTGTTAAVLPRKSHKTPGDSSRATKIAIGITVPLTLLCLAAIGYYLFRRHQASKRATSEEVVLSLSKLADQHED